MTKALYIGIQTPGTTSQMRCETLQRITPGWEWTTIDTDIPFHQARRIWRTIGFRWKSGPMVSAINQMVLREAGDDQYDLIWIDKAIYLTAQTVNRLRGAAETLVHFTPDTAFCANRSKHFFRTARMYDLLVTTKSFDIQQYDSLVGAEKVFRTTQAYDSRTHKPPFGIENEKRLEAVFIGLCEPDRQRCIATLLDAGISVRLGGRGWQRFVSRYQSCDLLDFIGPRVFGDAYVSAISGAAVGLGLLSKRFPELHTTRTLEIPACGTVLATERNVETTGIFQDDEALFFDDYGDLAARLADLLCDREALCTLAAAGHRRVTDGPYSYEKVLGSVLERLGLHY